MLLESVRNMVSLSTPRPQPAVGGNPYSRAVSNPVGGGAGWGGGGGGGVTLMLLESVRNMVSLSTPRPQPAVGGNPYSRAVQKFSSTNIASSSPAALSCEEQNEASSSVSL